MRKIVIRDIQIHADSGQDANLKEEKNVFTYMLLVPDDDTIKALNQKCTNTFKQIEKELEQKDSEIKTCRIS
jgi:hypothetical protein